MKIYDATKNQWIPSISEQYVSKHLLRANIWNDIKRYAQEIEDLIPFLQQINIPASRLCCSLSYTPNKVQLIHEDLQIKMDP